MTAFEARKLLLSCGAISSLLYLVAIDVIVPMRHAGYHNFTSQMVSEFDGGRRRDAQAPNPIQERDALRNHDDERRTRRVRSDS
jgi:hypothetical protein